MRRCRFLALLALFALLLTACSAALSDPSALPEGTARLELTGVKSGTVTVRACDEAGEPLSQTEFTFALSKDFSGYFCPQNVAGAPAASTYTAAELPDYYAEAEKTGGFSPVCCKYSFNGAGELNYLDDDYHPALPPETVQGRLEVNQALSFSADYAQGTFDAPITELAAGKTTAILCRLLEPAEDAVLTVQTAQDTLTCTPDKALSDAETLYFFLDGASLPAGHAEFCVSTGSYDYVTEADFTQMRTLTMLLVPIRISLWEGNVQEPAEGWQSVDWLLRACYPLADDALTVERGSLLDLTEYALEDAQVSDRIFERLEQLAVENGYDIAVGLVPDYFENGLTGKSNGFHACIVNASAIDAAATLAHEVGHIYALGDEYEGGAFNMECNPTAYGLTGVDWFDREREIVADVPGIQSASEAGLICSGSLVPAQCVPFDAQARRAVEPAASILCNGGESSENYWVSPDIWHRLFTALRVREFDVSVNGESGFVFNGDGTMTIYCANCFHESPADEAEILAYCPSCAGLNPVESAAQAEHSLCPACGAETENAAVFYRCPFAHCGILIQFTPGEPIAMG